MMVRICGCCQCLKKCCAASGLFLSTWKEELKHVAILSAITFFLILPVLCRHLQYSVYYIREGVEPERAKMIKENDMRLQQAHEFFSNRERRYSNLSFDNYVHSNATQSLDIMIGIITISRNTHKVTQYEPQYLTQVVWKFLSLMEKKDKTHLRLGLFVCNVDGNPKRYIEAQNISGFVPVVNRYENQFSTSRADTGNNIIEKEKDDYVFCLNQSLRTRPRHVLLVEDDALPHNKILQVLEYCLQNHIDQSFLHGSHRTLAHQLAYVKFYHPERVIGYINIEVERLPELFGIGSIFGAILTQIYAKIFKKDKPRRMRLLYFLFAIYSMCVALAIGRPHLVNLRLISLYLTSYVPGPFCCTPAMLFPSVNAYKVVKFLSSIECKSGYAKDFALRDFCWETKLKPYLVQPNYFKHIGFVSSLRPSLLDPIIV